MGPAHLRKDRSEAANKLSVPEISTAIREIGQRREREWPAPRARMESALMLDVSPC